MGILTLGDQCVKVACVDRITQSPSKSVCLLGTEGVVFVASAVGQSR